MRFKGQFTLSIRFARKGTFYKYAVIKKGDIHYEYLAEFLPRYRGGIVNRFLRIPEKNLKPGGKITKLGRIDKKRDVIVRLVMKVKITTVIMMMMTFSKHIISK